MIARPPLAVPLTALAGFLVLLGLVVVGWTPLDSVDAAISDTFREYGQERPTLVDGLRVATDVAATLPFLSVGLATSVFMLARNERRAAAFCGTVTLLVPLLWASLHQLLHHPRPSGGFVDVDSNSFPSGHTSMATAAALAVVLLLWPRLVPAARVGTAIVAAVFAVFIGATRVALLAHWPVDVLGGWLLALAVVPLAAHVVVRAVAVDGRRVPSRRRGR